METIKTIIGIDPDVNESGVAILSPTGELTLFKMTFPQLVDHLFSCSASPASFIVVVEKGWFTQTNYHLRSGVGQRVSSKLGISIGRNHETGRKIVEMAEHYGLKVDAVPPLRKIWKSKDGKISKAELEAFTGPLPRCSQDERDAALLAWAYSGRPMRIIPQKMQQ